MNVENLELLSNVKMLEKLSKPQLMKYIRTNKLKFTKAQLMHKSKSFLAGILKEQIEQIFNKPTGKYGNRLSVNNLLSLNSNSVIEIEKKLIQLKIHETKQNIKTIIDEAPCTTFYSKQNLVPRLYFNKLMYVVEHANPSLTNVEIVGVASRMQRSLWKDLIIQKSPLMSKVKELRKLTEVKKKLNAGESQIPDLRIELLKLI
jgi:hypothetical protein